MAGRDEQVVAAQQLGAGDQAVFVDGQRQQVAGVAGEDIARVGIAGVFHADHGIVVDQQVGQQVERVLRAHGDDDLGRVGPDAPARQHLGADLLDQRGVVVGDEVRRPAADVQHRQRLDTALAPFGGGKQVLVELAIDEGVGLLLPVARLDDIALQRGAETQSLVPARGAPRVIGRRCCGGRAMARRGFCGCPCMTESLTKWPLRSRDTR